MNQPWGVYREHALLCWKQSCNSIASLGQLFCHLPALHQTVWTWSFTSFACHEVNSLKTPLLLACQIWSLWGNKMGRTVSKNLTTGSNSWSWNALTSIDFVPFSIAGNFTGVCPRFLRRHLQIQTDTTAYTRVRLRCRRDLTENNP